MAEDTNNATLGSIQEKNTESFITDYIRLFFDTVIDDNVSFQSQITDNYVENNTAIQDHIAIAPIIVTLNGLCGEKVYTQKEAANDDANLLAFIDYQQQKEESKLRTIEVYLPQLSNADAVANNVKTLIDAAKTKADVIFDRFQSKLDKNKAMTTYSNLPSNIRQEIIKKKANYLKEAWQSRKSFIVETPFGTFDNMYIQSVTLHQGNENYKADVSVTLKQIRFTDVGTTGANQAILSQYNQLAQAEQQNNGKTKGVNSRWYDHFANGAEYKNR